MYFRLMKAVPVFHEVAPDSKNIKKIDLQLQPGAVVKLRGIKTARLNGQAIAVAVPEHQQFYLLRDDIDGAIQHVEEIVH